jgi:hypothetical protein
MVLSEQTAPWRLVAWNIREPPAGRELENY